VAGAVGRYDSEQDSIVSRFVQLELEGRYERMRSRRRIDFLNSGNCAFRRETILHYPFDEDFHRLEDVELSFRLARDGLDLVYAPGARAHHRHPERFWSLLRRKFNYARYALPLYRRYPDKAVSDSSTPPTRRARLVLLGLSVLFLLGAWIHPAALALSAASAIGWLVLSSNVIGKAFRISPSFGLASLSLVLFGNLAFLAGAVRGLLAGRAPHAN
jgi:GT2 family glycosyltransferase